MSFWNSSLNTLEVLLLLWTLSSSAMRLRATSRPLWSELTCRWRIYLTSWKIEL